MCGAHLSVCPFVAFLICNYISHREIYPVVLYISGLVTERVSSSNMVLYGRNWRLKKWNCKRINIRLLTSVPVASAEAVFVTNINHCSVNQIWLQCPFRYLARLGSLNIRVSCDCMWAPIFIQNQQGSLLTIVREHGLYRLKCYLARSPRTCLNKY
jgi:hypothetical protein